MRPFFILSIFAGVSLAIFTASSNGIPNSTAVLTHSSSVALLPAIVPSARRAAPSFKNGVGAVYFIGFFCF